MCIFLTFLRLLLVCCKRVEVARDLQGPRDSLEKTCSCVSAGVACRACDYGVVSYVTC